MIMPRVDGKDGSTRCCHPSGPGAISLVCSMLLPPFGVVSAEEGASCPAQASQVYAWTERAAFPSAHGKSMSPGLGAPEAS